LELLNHLKELEKMLLMQSVRTNVDILDVLLADEFLEISEAGNAWTKQTAIETLKSEVFSERTITDFKLTMLTDNIVLVTYKAHRHENEHIPAADSHRCSIWKQSGANWRIVYHQGTPIQQG